jgi:prolyl-tRNA synthetase
MLDEINEDLKKRAWESFKEAIRDVSDLGTIKRAVEKRGGIFRVSWCGREACGKAIEDQTGCDLLGEEFEGKVQAGTCPICSKRAKTSVLIAKTY